ncbi:MAG: 4Fe-4S binding protein [Bacillota bacterium]
METARIVIHKWGWIILLFFCGVGLFYPIIGLLAIVCMLGPSVYALVKNGRGWCGTYCPRGSFSDVILPGISSNNDIPQFVVSPWFRLAFLALLMIAFGIQLVFAWGNSFEVGMVFVRMIIITTALTIILGVAYRPRTWCTFCPMGTMAHYITKWKSPGCRGEYVTFKKDSCIDCSRCSRVCPMHIDLLEHKESGVTEPDCIKCGICISKCPKKAISLQPAAHSGELRVPENPSKAAITSQG